MTSYAQPQQNFRISDQPQQMHFRSFEANSPSTHTTTITSDIAETQPTQTYTTDNSTSVFSRHHRSQSYASVSGNTGENSKRLSTLLGAQHSGPKTPSSSKALSFHSPADRTPKNKSIRQKIGNAKPITPSRSLVKDGNTSVKNSNAPKIGTANRMIRNSFGKYMTSLTTSANSMKLGSINHKKTPSDGHLFKTQPDEGPGRRPSESKINQVTAIYSEQGAAERVRKPRTHTNTSGLRSSNVTPSPNNSQLNISRHASAQSLKPLPTYTNYAPNPLNVGECFTDADKHQRATTQKHYQSPMAVDKDMILGGYKPPGTGYHNKKAQEGGNLTLSNSSVFNNLTKDLNKKTNINNYPVPSTFGPSGYLNLGNSISTTILNSNGTSTSAWDNSMQQSQANRDEALENRIEALLSQKTVETSHLEDISSTLELAVDAVTESVSGREGQRNRNILRKIKLAYQLFFQNYSHHHTLLQNKFEEAYKNLKRDHEVLEVKSNAANNELENVKIENQKLRQQLKLRDSASKKSQFDNEETPPNNKYNNSGFSQLHDAEALKIVARDQQKTIQSLKKKEAKMIRLLYACKKKGLDIEQIYHEDVKSSLEREEEDIPTLSKSQKLQQNQNCLFNNHKAAYQSYAFDTKELENELEQATTNMQAYDNSSYISNDLYQQDNDKERSVDAEDHDIVKQSSSKQIKQHEKLESGLKNKLKLDFTQLKNPKENNALPQQQVEFEIHEVPSVQSKDKSHYKHTKHLSTLQLDSLKEDEKSPGFHDEFMSKMDEFSISWRQAALKERKLPK